MLETSPGDVGGDEFAKVLDVDTLDVVGAVEADGNFRVAFSPDGALLATICSSLSRQPEVNLWSVGKR